MQGSIKGVRGCVRADREKITIINVSFGNNISDNADNAYKNDMTADEDMTVNSSLACLSIMTNVCALVDFRGLSLLFNAFIFHYRMVHVKCLI